MTGAAAARDALALAEAVAEIARDAALAIIAALAAGVNVRHKDDVSPVTEADEAANALITDRLLALTPGVPVIAEESYAAGQPPPAPGQLYWLVDPLDGTKEFIAGRDEYTVNIALIEGGRPLLGVVQLPALDELYLGIVGQTAFRRQGAGQARPIRARKVPGEGATVLVSRSHYDASTERLLAGVAVRETRAAGSSVKFCLIAAGEADIYPRLGRTMEWDTAAGHAVLIAAGGSVCTLDGAALGYGKPGLLNPALIARGA